MSQSYGYGSAEPVPSQYTYDENNPVNPYTAGGEDPLPEVDDATKKSRFAYSASGFRDPLFAVLFLAHLLIVAVVAAMYRSSVTGLIDKPASSDDVISVKEAVTLVTALVVAAGAGLIFGWLYLKAIQIYAKQIILAGVVVNTVMNLILAAILFASGSMLGVLFLFMAAINICYYLVMRPRMPFTQAVLEAAGKSIQDHSGSICVTIMLAFLQIGWVALWAFTTVAVFSKFYQDAQDKGEPMEDVYTGTNGVCYFMLLISFYWTSQVIKNVGHVTTAGAVASWWLLPNVTSAVGPAFKRAMTTSFGSICFGSLIVAVLSAIRDFARAAQNSARRSDNQCAACALCLFACIVSCIENLMEYFNMYAFTQVAIYGKDFISAAKATLALFRARGFDIIINDHLTGFVIWMGCLGGGVVGLLAGGGVGLVSSGSSNSGIIAVAAILGFLAGLLMVSLMMSVVQSAVATTFVVWAETPQELSVSRPNYYGKLIEAARVRFPERMF